jgi:CRISPR-associated protein Csb2
MVEVIMPSHFALSVRFLDPAFHGRRDGGDPEWPPSPLRVFQSLVAAAAARGRGEGVTPHESALRWLEQQPAPTMLAPVGIAGTGYRLSVPNNAMDVVARAWARGNVNNTGDANPATHRTMKTVRPTWLVGGDVVHYLWPLASPPADDVCAEVGKLCSIASSIVALGWGTDMVVGHGAIVSDAEVAALSGERWLPSVGGDGLRVPVRGTLDALVHRHERFLHRLGIDGLTPPTPLSTFDTIAYRRAIDPPQRATAAFSLLKLDASGFRAFGTVRRALTVAGMTRHAAKVATSAAGWPESKINAFVLGHGEPSANDEHVAVGPRRFVYLPLPSIEERGEGKVVAGSVRRVLLSSIAEDCDREVAWARRSLAGQELIDEDTNQPVALLSLLPATDAVVRRYTQRAASWATVTPVVLPGHDDPAHYRRRLKRGTTTAEEQKGLLQRLHDRVDGLLRKAVTQAGFSQILADHVELEWRKVGFWPGTDLAERYGVPDHLKRFPRFHVRLVWRDANKRTVQVPGPVCLGGGRYYGLGLFAVAPGVDQ